MWSLRDASERKASRVFRESQRNVAELWRNMREDTLRALVARTAQRTAGDGVASLLTGNIVRTLGNIGKYACVL